MTGDKMSLACPYCRNRVIYTGQVQPTSVGLPAPQTYECTGCMAEFVYHDGELMFINGKPKDMPVYEPIIVED